MKIPVTYARNTVCKSTVPNMVTVPNFEVIFRKYNKD